MPAVSEDIIDEIRSRSDIVDVIGSYIPLKRAGGNAWKACCPFHNEKTPSFHVDGSRQLFYCFGCGKGGDLFKFICEREGVNFYEAIHMLANRCGVIIPETGPDREVNRQATNQRERLYALHEEFAQFFELTLRKNPNSPAAQYLNSRNLDPEQIKQFRIGAAPDEWEGCLRYGRSIGFTDQEMLIGGIVRKSEKTGKLYDHFKGRLTFAIWNEQGKVVGFSARSLEAKPQTAKYVNTPETPIFKKGQLLYALPFARKMMQDKRQAILCEGQLDTIAFHRANFCECVAPQGTGFTTEQAWILHRYADTILLAFDADAAGQKAIRSAIETLLPKEFEIKAITIPGGKDPDELYKTGGATAVAVAVENAQSWIEHQINSFKNKYDMTSPAGVARAIGEFVDLLMLVPNSVMQELYAKEIATLLNINIENIISEISRRKRQAKRRFNGGGVAPSPTENTPQPLKKAPQTAIEDALTTLLILALSSDEMARQLSDDLPTTLPQVGMLSEALNITLGASLNGEHASAVQKISLVLNDRPDERVTRLLFAPPELNPEQIPKLLSDSIKELDNRKVIKSRENLLLALKSCNDSNERLKILAKLSTI